jgi:16S rRNA (guanine1207-N2)-methyltransferase
MRGSLATVAQPERFAGAVRRSGSPPRFAAAHRLESTAVATEHYFSADPSSTQDRRTITVRLADRDLRVVTAGGTFSPEHLDTGTRVLLDEVPPPPPTGALLDLGCGWGPIALTLGLLSPEADVYAVDVNERALGLTRENAAAFGLERVLACRPEDVDPQIRFATIWSNPPIRVGKAVLHDLLATWLPRLEPDGTAYLVVAKNLGADSLARWIEHDLGMPCRRLAIARGFRVLAVSR